MFSANVKPARSTIHGWCELWHIGTHPYEKEHQWFSFTLSGDGYNQPGGF